MKDVLQALIAAVAAIAVIGIVAYGCTENMNSDRETRLARYEACVDNGGVPIQRWDTCVWSAESNPGGAGG